MTGRSVPLLRDPFAVAGLAFVNIGAAIPFGISDLSSRTNANAAEWTLSAAFAIAAIVAVIGAFTATRFLSWAAFGSGMLWLIAEAYIATDEKVGGWARVGLSLIFMGVALGSFAWWRVTRVMTE
jgi:hypothetical protein